MFVEILGSAAGGGFPQWNCGCENCRSVRAGGFQGKIRSQTQVALSNDGVTWYLLSASPDLRLQIERTPALHPRGFGRGSPIAGVILTGADIDQIAGLLSLRELQPFRVFCSSSVRRILHEDNSIFGMLNRIEEQVNWTDIRVGEKLSLLSVDGGQSGLCCEAIALGGGYPAYVPAERASALTPQEGQLGLILTAESGGRLAYMPAVPVIGDELLELLKDVDLVLFDGTFWTNDELIRVHGSGATAQEMGHVPVSGTRGSLSRLAGLKRPRKIFVHINNTNPMLDESSTEHREVLAAGWEISEDGWRFRL
jgi:pyrroloquinoline quinone biosynthesis protein B